MRVLIWEFESPEIERIHLVAGWLGVQLLLGDQERSVDWQFHDFLNFLLPPIDHNLILS